MKNYLRKQLYSIGFYPVLFVILLWIIFGIQNHYHLPWVKWGVLPREAAGLPGIVTSVLIHGDFGHLASNTLPLLALGAMMFYFYKKIALPSILWIWLISGLWLWIGGRNNDTYPMYHIGASTLIYGLATFLFFSGVFRRHLRLMVVSALVVFLYGGIVWGVLPIQPEISFEGHLFGAIAGILVAYNYRKEGPQRREYVWEEEIESENEGQSENESDEAIHSLNPNQLLDPEAKEIRIRYLYKMKEKKIDSDDAKQNGKRSPEQNE